MKLNTLYTTFQGEVNAFGIGSSAIFLRLQGCHIRCYKLTMGILCDTPESLKKPTEKDPVYDIIQKTIALSKETGVKVVTLTGGDPLWNDEADLKELFLGLTGAGLSVSVETSGTLSWLPYSSIEGLYWVLDYKLQSAGVKNADKLFLDKYHTDDLTEQDYIKFVIYDTSDLEEAINAIHSLKDKTLANLAVGAYWGGKISTLDIFKRFEKEGLLGSITINAQLHKLVIAPNINAKIPIDV